MLPQTTSVNALRRTHRRRNSGSHSPGFFQQAQSAKYCASRFSSISQFRRTPAAQKLHAGGLIGSPDTIRRKLRKFEGSHVDQVILLNQAGRNTHPDICDSLELFAREVMPEFVDRHPEQEQWKREVLSGERILPRLDTSPEAVPRPVRR